MFFDKQHHILAENLYIVRFLGLNNELEAYDLFVSCINLPVDTFSWTWLAKTMTRLFGLNGGNYSSG